MSADRPEIKEEKDAEKAHQAQLEKARLAKLATHPARPTLLTVADVLAAPTAEDQAKARDGIGVKVLASVSALAVAKDAMGNRLTDVRDERVVPGVGVIPARDRRSGAVIPGERDVPDERGLIGSRQVTSGGKLVTINRAGWVLDANGEPTTERLVLATEPVVATFDRVGHRAPRPGEKGHRTADKPGNARRFDVVYFDRSSGIEIAPSANEVRELVRRRHGKDPLSIKLIRE